MPLLFSFWLINGLFITKFLSMYNLFCFVSYWETTCRFNACSNFWSSGYCSLLNNLWHFSTFERNFVISSLLMFRILIKYLRTSLWTITYYLRSLLSIMVTIPCCDEDNRESFFLNRESISCRLLNSIGEYGSFMKETLDISTTEYSYDIFWHIPSEA